MWLNSVKVVMEEKRKKGDYGMGKILMCGSFKGGVGKTASSWNLAYSLAGMGKKVLAVDFDSQANLTTCFGIEDPAAVPVTIGHLMMNRLEDEEMLDPSEFIRSRNGVDFIPSSMMLSAVDSKLRMEMGSEKMLDGILEPLRGLYDYIIVDTCPSLGTLTINAKVPIIMLTARSDERDELLGFELGVDEYISKPFSPKILVARVEAILRRTGQNNPEDVISAGGIVIDKAAHLATVDGKPMELSFKEFELLTYFLENQGIALSREKILNSVWNYDYFGDARTIDTHVKKLRSKMGDKGEYIKTVWGMGYKFEVDE